MKKLIKWTFIIGGSLVVLVIAALILIPMFVDIQKHKPRIESEVAKATGRTFMLGGDLNLSLFPWASLSFSDLHLGNPPGFEEKDFVSIESFDVRVKLLPLLFKDIQVKRFILKGTRIVLETTKDGKVSWAFGKKSMDDDSMSKTKKTGDAKPTEGVFLKALAVGKFSITDGSVVWLDQIKKDRKEISQVSLVLQDISLDRPVQLKFSARLDNRPISLGGSVGPLGKEFGKGTIPLDLLVKALDQLDVSLKGYVIDPAIRPRFDLDIQVSSFSPRKLVAGLGTAFPISTADPKVLNQLALKVTVKGDTQAVSVSNGILNLDESQLNFTANAKDFSKPDIAFDVKLNHIDLDKYLPPPSEETSAEKDKKVSGLKSSQKKIDYAPLRKMVLNGALQIGKLKIKNARIENLHVKIMGNKGIFNIDPLAMTLYQGGVGAKAFLNVQKDTPASNFQLTAKGIQSGPLLVDVLNKDILEGALKANITLNMTGDDAGKIKRSLNGNGALLFNDGAIKGIDLAGMVRNVKATFGLAEAGQKKPKTDFAELNVPFTITGGVVNTSNTSLTSPLIRVATAGKADLVGESLDFRVEPKFVATLKGQGDTKDRSGLTVPVLVTGTFSSPKFRPDLEGMFRQKIEKGLPDLKKQLLEGGAEKGESKPIEKKVKDIFKSFGSGS